MKPETKTTLRMHLLQATQPSTSRLFQLVEQLVKSSQPSIEKSHSCIINDIPEDLVVLANHEMLSSVLSGMINIAIVHAKDSCIRISARMDSDDVMVNLRDYNRFNSYSSPYGFHHVQTLATRLGGSLAVAAMRQGEKTIALRFPNRKDAA